MTNISIALSKLTEDTRPVTYGVVKPGPEDNETGVRFVRGGDLSEGKVKIDELRTITQDVSAEYRRTLLTGGELLISLVGNPGEVALAPVSLKGANIARQVGLVALRPEENSKYVMYFLRSPLGRSRMFQRTQGAVQQVINLKDLKEILIDFPSPEKQTKIVECLERYGDLIENNRRRIALLEESARLLYREWFVRLSGNELPSGWHAGKISDLGEVITGKTPSKKKEHFYGGDVPFIKTPDMHQNTFVISTEEALTEEGASSQKNKTIPAFSCLVSCIGTLGVVSLTQKKSQFNQQINAVVARNKPWAIYNWCALKEIKPKLEVFGHGSTMANVNKTKFSGVEVIVPDDKTVTDFYHACEPIVLQIEKLQLSNNALTKARDLLLPRLMDGRVAV